MFEINFNKPIHIYFMGIGGISMSGLAELLLSKGFSVSGSDMKESALTQKLESLGAKICYGQAYEHITKDIDLIVYTAAIHPDNPEWQAMIDLQIPHLSRAELLGQVMTNYQVPIAVAGTHGKTTTTSMISEILLAQDLDPTLSIGGILKSIGGNFRIGSDQIFVTEACEYTNSFLSFFPKVAIILNVEEDHMDFFKDLNEIKQSFHRFAALLPADGTLIINGDIPDVEAITEGLSCQIIKVGCSADHDYSPSDIRYNNFGCATFTLCKKGVPSLTELSLSVPGLHNVYNALAAAALADLLHVEEATLRTALSGFHGTDRRFQYKGECNGFTIIDDYAHHPTEIAATLDAAQNYPHKTLWCIFQPHTYTRTKAFFSDFAKALKKADRVILADIYAARETDTLNMSSKLLCKEVNKEGGNCIYLPSFEAIKEYVLKNCTKDDLLITMGAGDVVNIGEMLLSK